MHWNKGRQRRRLAWAAKEGVELAMGRGTIPRAYFDVATETPEEAAELEYKVNTARREKEALAKLRGGGGGWQ